MAKVLNTGPNAAMDAAPSHYLKPFAVPSSRRSSGHASVIRKA